MIEICGRCLVNLDARSSVAAVKEGQYEPAPNMAPWPLKAWAQEKAADGYVFEQYTSSGVLIAISTWNGDPVCAVHLWTLVDLEMKRGYR